MEGQWERFFYVFDCEQLFSSHCLVFVVAPGCAQENALGMASARVGCLRFQSRLQFSVVSNCRAIFVKSLNRDPATVSPDAAARLEEDLRRYPATAYEAHSLLWKDTEWRHPSLAKKMQRHARPPEAIASLGAPGRNVR